jgi:hypothetical protein
MHVNGVFRAIDAPSRLIFSWNIEAPDEDAGVQSEVRVSITPHEVGCELHIRHIDLARPGAPERHTEGWKGAPTIWQSCSRRRNKHDALWTRLNRHSAHP